MLGSELLFHFMNVMLMTGLVAPLVLWRYRRAVLAGMQAKAGAALPLAPPQGVRPRAAEAAFGVAAELAWEARVRRRVFVAVVAALAPPVTLLAANHIVLNELHRTVSTFWLVAGSAMLMAVPMFAVLVAMPFARAVAIGVATLAAFAVAVVPLTMAERAFAGRLPSL